MELELVRIELPGGDYAMAYKDVLRKTARLHEAELRKYMTPKPEAKTTVMQSELEANPAANLAIDYEVDLLAVEQNQDAINELYILHQVPEWSFGPVDAEVLENRVTDAQYKALVKELNRLYKPSPLSKGS